MIFELLVFALVLGILGYGLIFYLQKIINKNNDLLLINYEKNNKNLIAIYENIFNTFQKSLASNHENYTKEIKVFSNTLKKETDKYTETINKYRDNLNSLSQTTKEMVVSNNNFAKELHSKSFQDLQNINESLKTIIDSYTTHTTAFNNNSKVLEQFLKGLSSMQKIFIESEKNLSNLSNLNNNYNDLIKHFKEITVQLQLVSNSISVVAETKIKPLLDSVNSLMPEARDLASNISGNLYGKFSDALDKLDKINDELLSITIKYNALIEGSRKDNVTGEFLR